MIKYLERIKITSKEIDPRHHRFLLPAEFLKVFVKKPRSNTIIHRFSQAFDKGKIEQILLAYGLPQDTLSAIMMLYKDMKVKVRSPDGDTNYFDIVAGVLKRDTLAPYLFIICIDYVLQTSVNLMKENGFKLAKKRSRNHPT